MAENLKFFIWVETNLKNANVSTLTPPKTLARTPRGFGFVSFKSDDDVSKVLAINHVIKGKEVSSLWDARSRKARAKRARER